MAGLNEKTVRRALKELARLGLISVRHRFENTNLYYLIIPPAAEAHARTCVNLLTNPRNRAASNGQKPASNLLANSSQMSGAVDNYAHRDDVNVQGHSDRHSDLHSISKRDAPHPIAISKPRDLAEEKRLSEGLKALRAELARSPDPLLNRRD
jgi:hypothetical protein